MFRVVFLGRGRVGMNILEGLIHEPGVELTGVFTCRATPEVGFTEDDFAGVAAQHGVEFFFTNNLNTPSAVDDLSRLDADLGVTVSWVHTIASDPIATARHGFINAHGGLLPTYRGNACQAWAILNGEYEIGVTCHLMEPGRLDSGPIILQERVPLNPDTTVGDLYHQAETISSRLILEAVRLFTAGKVAPQEQNEAEASYCYPRLPRDGELDWNASSDEVMLLIRAAGRPYPGAYSFFADVMDEHRVKKMTVLEAHTEEHPLKEFYAVPGHLLKLDGGAKWAVATGDKKLVVLDAIEIDGHPREPSTYFRSVRQRMGLDLQAEVADLKRQVAELRGTLGGSINEELR